MTGWGWGMVEPDTLGGDEGVRSGIDWRGLFVITCDGFWPCERRDGRVELEGFIQTHYRPLLRTTPFS